VTSLYYYRGFLHADIDHCSMHRLDHRIYILKAFVIHQLSRILTVHFRIVLATAFALFATLSGAMAAIAFNVPGVQFDDVRALDGEWVYVEDRTPNRTAEQQSPNMGPRIKYRIEKDAFVVVRSDGDIRMPLDGTATDVARSYGTSRYSGQWKDGAYVYQSVPVRAAEKTPKGVIRWELRPTAEGLLAKVILDPPSGRESVSLFRHPQDISLPTPAKATINDLAWLAGAWTGTRGATGAISIEERWSPPLGGAMLAVSRTVSRGKMGAFEYLRIVERDGGLVYIAQPGGRPPTEFVLTELGKNRAVFENPRHDSPQRIVYELAADGRLTALIGFNKGGKPQQFVFKREGS
jgi:hypothetical protein